MTSDLQKATFIILASKEKQSEKILKIVADFDVRKFEFLFERVVFL